MFSSLNCTLHLIQRRSHHHFWKAFNNIYLNIEGGFKAPCDAEISMKELDIALKQMSVGKSPGQDGLTSNFYTFFWEDMKELLFTALKECIKNNNLLATMKQGIIILLPKAGKDKRYIDNPRPITLLNVDYK